MKYLSFSTEYTPEPYCANMFHNYKSKHVQIMKQQMSNYKLTQKQHKQRTTDDDIYTTNKPLDLLCATFDRVTASNHK